MSKVEISKKLYEKLIESKSSKIKGLSNSVKQQIKIQNNGFINLTGKVENILKKACDAVRLMFRKLALSFSYTAVKTACF